MTSNTGVLYVVATPIGNLADISERAKSILELVDFVAAEDTRHSGRLLQHLGINKKLISLHDHNERQKAATIVQKLKNGQHIALVSDAGTPLISDPGYHLVREVRDADCKVVPIPGACALVAALSASGLATDRFIFEGFLPAKSGARRKHLQSLVNEARSIVFYESTHRIEDSLKDMESIFGDTRLVTIARELTKTFETIKTDKLSNIIKWIDEDSDQKRGEFVVIASGNPQALTADESESDRVVDILMTKLPLAQATSLASEITGQRKKGLYQRALDRK
ncbi:MAG: 16S rRNA (cytidine(1402)-2'-O)-methyltransferase [Gammaproteobacteria bacterium]|nr:MAG: 16S rRNA (cytidine(1402)-2'-O)-methyltransferase [Gammaproteobacteria bacterium]